jgi:hypothetical protein
MMRAPAGAHDTDDTNTGTARLVARASACGGKSPQDCASPPGPAKAGGGRTAQA